MKQVPYHGNPGNACALACYTMVAQYLLPGLNITFEQLGKIANWKKGYVVWAFPFWKWMMDKDVHITDIDVIDYGLWSKEGTDGLRKSVSAQEFEFYKSNTLDMDKISKQLALAINHPNFNYVKKKLVWDDVMQEVKKSGICDITLDGRMLHRTEGFTVHRVVIIDITDKEVIFHDPVADNSGAYKHESIEHFQASFEHLDGAELARYSLT